jgi:hypothetical protein
MTEESQEHLAPREPDAAQKKVSPKKSSLRSTIAWIIIAIMLTLIAAWTVWAARQSDIRSLWAPE